MRIPPTNLLEYHLFSSKILTVNFLLIDPKEMFVEGTGGTVGRFRIFAEAAIISSFSPRKRTLLIIQGHINTVLQIYG